MKTPAAELRDKIQNIIGNGGENWRNTLYPKKVVKKADAILDAVTFYVVSRDEELIKEVENLTNKGFGTEVHTPEEGQGYFNAIDDVIALIKKRP